MLRNKHIRTLKKLLRAVDGRVGRRVRAQKCHSHVISFPVLNAADPILKNGAADYIIEERVRETAAPPLF